MSGDLHGLGHEAGGGQAFDRLGRGGAARDLGLGLRRQFGVGQNLAQRAVELHQGLGGLRHVS